MKHGFIVHIALAVAVSALAHSLWVQWQAPARADEALRRREAELVRKAAPHVAEACVNMLPSFDEAGFQPATIEDLLRPVSEVISRFAEPQVEATAEPTR